MNSTFLKQNLKIILTVGIGVLILLAGIIIYNNQNTNQNESKTKENETTSEVKSLVKPVIIETEKPIAETLIALKNTQYTGISLQILTSALSFPSSNLAFSGEDNFVLTASGLSLSLLGNTALAVQGQYPIVEINASGKYTVSEDKSSTDLKVSVLNFVFSINGKAVEAAASQVILTEVAKSGIILPEVSPASPAVVSVSVQINADALLTVKSTANSVYYLNFVGKK